MIMLKVKHLGSFYSELPLEEGQEYFIGRDKKCALVLESSKGISRKHLRVFQDNGVWVVECLSRLGNLKYEGESVPSLELGHLAEFSVGSYVFQFEEVVDEEPVAEEPAEENADQNYEDVPDDANIFEQEQAPKNALVTKATGAMSPQHNQVAPDNQTQLLNSSLKAFLKITGTESGNDSILELEGNLWVAGRDPSCEIHINDNLASRKHFEIKRIGQEFFVLDLDSANGTELNGSELPAHKPVKILSGDQINIQSVTLHFEVRDVDFENKFEMAKKQLATLPQQPMGYHQPPPNMMMQLPPPDFSQGGVFEESAEEEKTGNPLKDFDFKKHKVKVIIGLLVPILIIGLMDDGGSEKEKGKTESASNSQTFESLTEEQRGAVKHTFNLAQQHYINQKYELCMSELKKLHNIIPSYENSKKIKGLCEHGAMLLRQEEDRIAREKKQQETEQIIITTVEYCQTRTTAKTTMDEAQICLQKAIELDPQHPNVVAYLEEIKQRELNKQNAAAQAAARRAQQAKGRAHLSRAKRLAQKDELANAIKVYKSFLSANYPGLATEKASAKRELASVSKKLNNKINSLLEECEALKSNNKFKDAWLTCDKASKEDPSNQRAKDLKTQTLSELRREMKSIYQDAILEESLGNVPTAKEKWQLIRKNNLEFDDFYKKATRKLKKYGEGI